jgi:4-azaleucine resistance transporter AzlC
MSEVAPPSQDITAEVTPAAPHGGFLAGVRDCLPVVLGYLAIGLAFGVVARTAGLSVLEATLMSVVLYAGSAQFITVGLIAAGAPALATIITVGLVNIRHMFYSAALAPHLQRAPLWKNALIGVELTDETFAVVASRLGTGTVVQHGWMFGVNITAQLTWVIATLLGALLGQRIPDVSALGLDYALTAMFAALLVLQIAHRPQLRIAIGVAVVAAAVAVAGGLLLSTSWAIVLAAVVASTLGMALEERQS